MNVTPATVWLLITLLAVVVLWMCFKCRQRHIEDENAMKVLGELQKNRDGVPEASDQDIVESFENKKVYMAELPQENSKEPFGYIPHSYVKGHNTPIGEPMYMHADLYDWRPFTYYGGMWIKQFYPPTYKKTKVWRKGSWVRNNENFYYVTK